MRHYSLAVLAALSITACSQKPTVVSLAPEPGPAKQRAKAAFQEFATQLKGELQAAMKLGGPVKAVEVCSQKAPQIAQRLSQEHGFEIGRSSHRLRNPENAPSTTIEAYLKKYADRPAKEAVLEISEENGNWVVVAPIETLPLCLSCHGSPDTFSTELKSALSTYYPQDQATGFKAGDLRGVIWARMPQEMGSGGDNLPLDPSSRKIKTH